MTVIGIGVQATRESLGREKPLGVIGVTSRLAVLIHEGERLSFRIKRAARRSSIGIAGTKQITSGIVGIFRDISVGIGQ